MQPSALRSEDFIFRIGNMRVPGDGAAMEGRMARDSR